MGLSLFVLGKDEPSPDQPPGPRPYVSSRSVVFAPALYEGGRVIQPHQAFSISRS